MDKKSSAPQPTGLEKFLGFSTITGWTLISLFSIGIISIVLQGLQHVSPIAVGDEYFYVLDAQNISTNGIYNEMVHGNPIGYSIVLNLISRIGLSTLAAGRMLSSISTVFVFISLYVIGKRHFNLSRPYLLLATMTCLVGILISGNYFFVAADDMYYAAFFIWIAVYLWKIVNNWGNWLKFALAGALLSATLLIRPLALVIFPATIVALVYSAYLAKHSIFTKAISIFAYIIAFGAVFFLQQSPALLNKGHIVLENKIADSVGTRVNWVQKLELSNILREEGKKREENGEAGGFASWKQCNDYLNMHGSKSLPSSIIQRFLWNPWYCIKYFGIGAFKILFILARHVGIAFIFPFIFLFRTDFPRYRKIAFFEIFCLAYLVMYTIATLNFVEVRHLIIPIIFTVLTGIYILQAMEKAHYNQAPAWALAQLGIIFLILVLDLDLYFFGTTDWIFYG